MNKLEQISRNWEAFKQQNETRLEQLEKKHSVDPVTQSQLNKISRTIDTYQTSLAAAVNRPFSSIASK